LHPVINTTHHKGNPMTLRPDQSQDLQAYRPDKFARTYAVHNGAAIWKWLHQSQTILIMETACYLRRPAVEALSPALEKHFPKVLTSTKLRQMIGHMVRQILQARGHHLDRANVRIRQKKCSFHFGSAYLKAA
jgi:hypothetical protein